MQESEEMIKKHEAERNAKLSKLGAVYVKSNHTRFGNLNRADLNRIDLGKANLKSTPRPNFPIGSVNVGSDLVLGGGMGITKQSSRMRISDDTVSINTNSTYSASSFDDAFPDRDERQAGGKRRAGGLGQRILGLLSGRGRLAKTTQR